MNTVPLYDEVWCSQLDENKVKEMFVVTTVVPKIYVPMGKAVLIKKDDIHRHPGYVDVGKNIIVGTVELG